MSTAKKRSVGGRVKSPNSREHDKVKQKETRSPEAGSDVAGPSRERTSGENGTEGKSVSKKRYEEFIHYKFVGKSKIGICKLCEKKNIHVEIKMEKSNTSGIRRHLERKHKSYYDQLFPNDGVKDASQKTLQEMFSQQNHNKILDKTEFRLLLVEWLAAKMLPLSFFNDDLTQAFFAEVSPQYNYSRRTAMTTQVENVHHAMRTLVVELLGTNDSKLSFTIDGWTSIRNKSYYGITCSFIDDQWKMHSIAIDFVPSEGHHTGRDIATIFYHSLERSGLLHKIQGVTMDNATVNDVFMRELEEILEEKNIKFDAEDQHFHCFPHVLNLGVQDILKYLEADIVSEDSGDKDDDNESDFESDLDEDEDDEKEKNSPPIDKLRKLCKKLKRSEKLRIQLGHYCKLCDEDLVNFPLDVSTRWNSSYDMMTAGLKMKKSISSLAKNTENLKHLFLSDDEWALITVLQVNLRGFKILSKTLSGDQYVTLPSVVVGINILIDGIENLCKELDSKAVRSPIDVSVIHAFQKGRDKIVKYYMKSNWTYCAALILDPRHKVETFEMTSWGQEMKETSYQYFKDIFKKKYANIFEEEQANCDENADNEGEDDYTKAMNSLYSSGKERSKNWEDELNRYLREGRAPRNTDVLDWWKLNQTIFPRLARMARDVLAICASSVPSERLFSKAGLLLRKHRSRLSNDHIENLLCLNSWFLSALSDSLKSKLKASLNKNET